MLRRPVLWVASLLAAGLAVGIAGTPAGAASALQIGKVQYDSPGTDTRSLASLDAEYVVIKNTSSTSRSMTGYTIRDAQKHVYTFGTYTLRAGKSIRLHTGKGTNTATDRYWGSSNYIWNNGADNVTLSTRTGATLDTCSWSTRGVGYKYC